MTAPVNFDFIQSYVNFADRFEVPPQMHESIALALIAGAVNGNIHFEWGSEVPLDFWLMNVSGSGSGRSTAVRVHRAILEHAGLLNLDQKVGWGSPQGVIQYFAEHPTGLHVYSEASEFLGHLTEPRFRTLKPWLVDLYDNTNLPRGLNAYRVNPNRPNQATPPIIFEQAPRLTFVTTTSQEWLLRNIDRVDTTGGFLSRWIWNYMPTIHRLISKPIPANPQLIPALAGHLIKLSKLHGEVDLSRIEAIHDQWYTATFERWKQQPNQYLIAPYWNRHRVHVLKLAVIFELSRQAESLEVQTDSYLRAVAYLRQSEPSLFELLSTGMTTNGFDLYRMAAFVEDAGAEGMLLSKVTQEFHNMDSRLRAAQLRTLFEEGSIRVFRLTSTGGRPPTFLLEKKSADVFLAEHADAMEVIHWMAD